MRIFRNKMLVKIIASLCICLTLINFGASNKVYADWGGSLINPVVLLLTTIADGIIGILHNAIQLQEVTLIRVAEKPTWWESLGQASKKYMAIAVIAIVLTAVILAAAAPYFAAGAIVQGIGAALLQGLKIGAIAYLSYKVIDATGQKEFIVNSISEVLGIGWFPETIYMPAFTITPEQIFANKIVAFDVNFFEPSDEVVEVEKTVTNKEYTNSFYVSYVPEYDSQTTNIAVTLIETQSFEDALFFESIDYLWSDEFKLPSQKHTPQSISDDFASLSSGNTSFEKVLDEIDKNLESKGYPKLIRDKNTVTTTINSAEREKDENGDTTYGTYTMKFFYNYENSEEKEVTMAIILTFKSGLTYVEHTDTETITSTAAQLQDMVSKWYFNLRNLALLMLMLILIYTGIRIVIGSTSGEKAKYKERLMDWVVALCLVFIMHYIMAFAVELTEKFIELVDDIVDNKTNVEYVPLTEKQINFIKDQEEGENTENRPEYEYFAGNGYIVDSGGTKYLAWSTDLMGKFKIKSQTSEEGTANWVGYSFCYVVLVLETLFFVWTYFKRIVYMAFLTLVAPLVAMMYPIDKMNDGKAQAFDAWLKEYIFNLLIQPLHLLLYTVLVSVAYELASTNPVYPIVAIGFIMPAEKLLRSFFGFNKAKTPGVLGGAAGAALAFTGLQKVMRLGNNKGGNSKKGNSDKDNTKFKWANSNAVDEKEVIAKKAGATNNKKVSDEKYSENINLAKDKDENPLPVGTENSMSEVETASIAMAATTAGTTDGTTASTTASTTAATTAATGSQPAKITTPNPTQSENNKQKGRKRAVVKGVAKRYARLTGKKIADKINNTSFTRAAVRGVTGIYGATAMGMAGLALGVASGDPNKAFQYTTAGVAGGYSAGKALGGTAVDAVSVDTAKLKDEIDMAYHGEDYKKVKFEERAQKMIHDENKIDQIRMLTGKSYEESQEILETVGRNCLENEVTNMEDVATVWKMEQNGHSREEAIAALKFNQYLPSDLTKMGESDIEDYINRWTREYEEQGYDNARELGEISWDLASEANQVKSGLKKA